MRGSGASVDTDTADQKFEALQKYGTDLTAKAAHLDPIIGRDEEIRRCVRILCRRTKNNPVLIGDPGKGQAQSPLLLDRSPLAFCLLCPLWYYLQEPCSDAENSDIPLGHPLQTQQERTSKSLGMPKGFAGCTSAHGRRGGRHADSLPCAAKASARQQL